MIRLMFLCLIFLPLICRVSQGGVIVQVRNTELVVGGVGWIDVEIYSDNATEYLVSGVSYGFQITRAEGAIGELRFASIQDSSEQDLENYLFAQQHANGNNEFTAVTDENEPTSLTGGDYAVDFTPTSVTSGRKLIARLDVEHVLPFGTDASSAIGSEFWISMVASELEVQNEQGDILDPISISGSGTLKIVATPEPSSVVLLAIAGGGWYTFRKRRK